MWVTTKDGRHVNTDWFDEKGNDKHYNPDGSPKWEQTGDKEYYAGRGSDRTRIVWNSTFKHWQISRRTTFEHANTLEEAKEIANKYPFGFNKDKAVYTGPAPSHDARENQIKQNKSEADRKNADEKYKRKK